MSTRALAPGETRATRAQATRRRLLDATLQVLAEKGYRATTTIEVQRAADVSRGALLHHFASRTDLIIAAVEHLWRERLAEFPLMRFTGKPEDRIRWAVESLWHTINGRTGAATLELWMAARYDEELRDAMIPLERANARVMDGMWTDLFGADVAGAPGFPAAIDILIDAQCGATALSTWRSPERDSQRIDYWVQLIECMTRS